MSTPLRGWAPLLLAAVFVLQGCIVDSALNAFCPGGQGCPGGVEDGGADAGELDAGQLLPALSIDRSSYAFGTFVAGQVSAPLKLRVTNTGPGTLESLAAELSGGGAGGFILPDVSACAGLESAATCIVPLPFSPVSQETYAATLTLTATPGGSSAAVTVEGTGVAPGTLAITPASIDFGEIVQNGQSAAQAFRISNQGGAPTGSLTAELQGSDAIAFTLAADGCTGQVLAAGASCTVIARFSPVVPGARRASLTVSGAPGGSAVAGLDGRGLQAGAIGVGPSAKDFGQVGTHAPSAPFQFQVVNAGSTATGALSAALSGEHAAEFTLTDGCSGAPLNPGSTCSISVTFAPVTPGAKVASLVVTGDPGGSGFSALSGTGLLGPKLSTPSQVHSYGGVVIGDAGSATFSISNIGAITTGALTTALSDPGGPFAITGDGCLQVALDAGVSCDLTVAFAPTDAGTRSASLSVSATPGGSVTLSLSGTGLTPGALTLSPGSKAFADVLEGSSGTSTTFTISNVGQAPAGAGTVALTGTGAPDFTVLSEDCSVGPLAPGGSCSVSVKFAPTGPGNKSASLTVTATPGGSVAAALSGKALKQATLEVEPLSHTYPSVVVGTQGSAQAFSVTNTGDVTTGGLSVALGGTHVTSFSLSGNTCGTAALAPGASCSVSVSFAPVSPAGAKTASLSVSASPGGAPAVALGGTALTPAALSVTPSPQNFGSTLLNTPVDKTLTVSNTGEGTTSAISLSIGGTDSTLFTILAPLTGECRTAVTTLVGGASCNFRVRFQPTTEGAKVGTATAFATTGGSSVATLNGAGLTQAAMAATPSSLDFGTLATGTASASKSWVVTNNGDVATGTPTVSITGGDANQFAIVTNGCTAAIPAGQSCTVTVRFAPTTGGGKNATLQITANPGGSQSTSLLGTGWYRLTVTKAGTGVGTVTSSPAGISCGTTCAQDYAPGTAVTLTAGTANGGNSYFKGWGGACAAAGASRTCQVTMGAAQTATATFEPQTYNMVFLSSQVYSAGVGVAAFDKACNDLATAAGINNTTNNGFIAWVSSPASNARTRLGATIRGFVRLDGLPFADDQATLVSTMKMFHPLKVDERGAVVATPQAVWTGTQMDGTTAANTCTGWTSSSASVFGAIGRSDAGPGRWTHDTDAPCSTPQRLYCVQKLKAVALAPPAVSGAKRIWRTTTGWPVSGGLAGANSKCVAEKPVGVTSARAMLNTATAGIPVVSTTTYVRPDNAVVGSGAELLAGTLRTGIWQAADGSYPTGFYVLTGGGSPGAGSTAAYTCNSWTIGTATAGYSLTRAAYIFHNEWWGSRGDPCNTVEPIYCIEQ